MTDATLSIRFAGPMVSLQDAGRTGGLRFGVSPSGPMDRIGFAAAHAALGQPPSTAIEVSLGGVSLTTDTPLTCAVAGGDFDIDLAGQRYQGGQVLTLRAGDTLTLRAGRAGSWAYLAVAGDLDAPKWMGSTATHAPSGFGGGLISSGQKLRVTSPAVRDSRLGAIPAFTGHDTGPIRAVMGPQDQHFEDAALSLFATTTYRVGTAYDRMGMRLDGPPLALKSALSIPSEPILRGSVQVSGDGVPTVLLADHQSTGGYPKIATVVSCDTDRLTQYRSGDRVAFTPVSAEEATAQTRAFADRCSSYLSQIAEDRGTLADRLMRENLIHGLLTDDED